MKRFMLAGCLWPVLLGAQEVKQVSPVLSGAYRSLIHQDSSFILVKDSTNSMSSAVLKTNGQLYLYYQVRKINSSPDNRLQIKPAVTKTLYFSGNFSNTLEWQQANRVPALQQNYVQGKNNNGSLQWYGPETNELFSYGPAVQQLEFDGSNYNWDQHGRLVVKGNGTGLPAIAYNNSVLRTGFLQSRNFSAKARLETRYNHFSSLQYKAGQTDEKTFILQHKNKSSYQLLSLERNWKSWNAKANYSWREDNYEHSNRGGLLNRVYQNSLLSPVSFDIRQGNGQNSWSSVTDNPFFLLNNPSKGLVTEQHLADLSITHGFRYGRITLMQSLENRRQSSHESQLPGTAAYPAGILSDRFQHDRNYTLQANVNYNHYFSGSDLSVQGTLQYLLTNNQSTIRYTGTHPAYRYTRVTNEVALILLPVIREYKGEAGLNLVHKWYASTTTGRLYWLPSIAAFQRFNEIFGWNRASLKITISYNRFNSELPVNRSVSGLSLLHYSPENANQFLPVTELSSIHGLAPVEHREVQAGAEFQAGPGWNISGNWYNRNTQKDIYPFFRNNEIQAANIAGYYNRGIELQLRYSNMNYGNKKPTQQHSISFNRYRTKLISIVPGFENMAVAGFSTVYKALVKGEAPGVLVGNSWQRTADGQLIIGTDGFPLVNNQPKVLGNPIPDFIVKFNHRISYRRWTINLDWDWKKGGQTWNGTRALLDYYGRSAASGELRNTASYVFAGVQANGTHNTIPVSFYGPALPISQNRWVRYGHTGVAEAYIEPADMLRISTISLNWKLSMKKYLQSVSCTAYINNILLWSPYEGADPDQLLYEQPGTQGLDFFNLPAFRTAGITLTIQF